MESPLLPCPSAVASNTGSACRSSIIDRLALPPLETDESTDMPLSSCPSSTPPKTARAAENFPGPSTCATASSPAVERSPILRDQVQMSPLQSISRKISWSNMESLLAEAGPTARAEPMPSPLRSVARNISWSNMEVLDDEELRPEKTTPTKRTEREGKARKKTLRQKSSSLSNLAPEQNREKASRRSPHASPRPKTERKTVRPQRSSSLSRLDRPNRRSNDAEPSRKQRHTKPVGKSLSLRRQRTLSPTTKEKNVVDARPRKGVSETHGRKGVGPQADRRPSPLRSMVKSLSKRSFRAFSPSKSRQDEVDIRPQKKVQEKKSPNKTKNELSRERKPRGESPLKTVVRTLSLRRVSSPTKTRGEAIDIRPKDKKNAREASKSPKKEGRKPLGLSLDKHLSVSPCDQTNQSDCFSVASSRTGSRLLRTKSLLSLCSTTETAAVDTSTIAAAAIAAEEVRSCSPDRRNSGFQIRNSDASLSFRTQSSTCPDSPIRRHPKQPGDLLSSSMHSSPRRVVTDDTGLSLSQSTHSPTKGVRKQLSARSISMSPKSNTTARKVSLSPVRLPEPPLSPKTAAAGLSASLHGDPTHRRVRGMRHPPKTKHNNLNRSLHGGSVPF